MSDDDLTDDELLNLPGDEIPSGRLAEFFSRRAGIVQQRRIDERMAELSGNSAHHYMLSPDRDPREKHRREEAERRWLAEMIDIRDREDRLLARIDEQERIDRKRLEEIEDSALRLHDGRRAYVNGDGYVDEQGRELTGTDATEVREQHRQHPDAPTWAEHQKVRENCDEDERQRQKVLKDREEAEIDAKTLSPEEMERKHREAEQRMSAEEKEFSEKVETARTHVASKSQADLTASYSADYTDLYGGSPDAGRTTSYAKIQDAAGNTLAANFTPAAEGQGTPDNDQAPRPSSAPAPSTPA